MLDVHAPHETAHTWRDFFIHIATICVGLLIAVGLEQTVEAMHHGHERHALEAQLRDEAQRNFDLSQGNLARLKVQLDWINASIVALNTAPVTNGLIHRSVIPSPGHIFDVGLFDPSQTVWAVAKASGTVGLLPEDVAQVYARLDHEADELEIGKSSFLRASSAGVSMQRSLQGLSAPQLEFITIADRQTLLRLFSDSSSQFDAMIALELNESGACRSVLNGASTVNEVLQGMLAENQRFSSN
jgi:hypothetical protein